MTEEGAMACHAHPCHTEKAKRNLHFLFTSRTIIDDDHMVSTAWRNAVVQVFEVEERSLSGDGRRRTVIDLTRGAAAGTEARTRWGAPTRPVDLTE
ncbi:hypothetical protein [Streptomyces sp. NRRL S-37]|uniref:hypothetical protein n=1 Tax=Streptomyces sp. NRRL S-37 TaxID=1463903 RepID=UPI00131AC7CC|nr:hypothetical protein [Streptomyces sp. NRRL S-37]